MPRNSGTYTLPPIYHAEPGTTIRSVQHNAPLEDIAEALTASLPRDGSAGMTGNLPMGNNRITGLAPATAAAHAARFDQVLPVSGGTMTGTLQVPAGTEEDPGVKFANANNGIFWDVGGGPKFTASSSVIGQLRSGTALSQPYSIVTRQAGDARYMQDVTAGSGLTKTGTAPGSVSLSVDASVVRTSRQITAGMGIGGGGNLASNIDLTLSLGELPYAGGVSYTNPRVIAIDGTDDNTQVRLGPGDLQSNFGRCPVGRYGRDRYPTRHQPIWWRRSGAAVTGPSSGRCGRGGFSRSTPWRGRLAPQGSRNVSRSTSW